MPFVPTCGPTRHSTTKEPFQRTLYRQSAQVCVPLDLNHFNTEEYQAWAPVGRYATLRALFSVCVVWDLETKHIDIKCAFLKGMLHQDVYIVQPPILHDGTRVWRLKKALYGLKQARMLGVCMYGDQCRCYGRCVGGKVIRVQADCLY